MTPGTGAVNTAIATRLDTAWAATAWPAAGFDVYYAGMGLDPKTTERYVVVHPSFGTLRPKGIQSPKKCFQQFGWLIYDIADKSNSGRLQIQEIATEMTSVFLGGTPTVEAGGSEIRFTGADQDPEPFEADHHTIQRGRVFFDYDTLTL